MSNSPLPEYLELHRRKVALKEELKAVSDQLAQLQDVVQEYLVDAGIDRETVSGHTLALRRTLWIGRQEGVTAGEFATALREVPELAQYARDSCDTQGLSAAIRSLERELEAEDSERIPSLDDLRAEISLRYGPEVAAAMKFSEKYEISVTKSQRNAAVARAGASKDLDDDLDDHIPY